MSATSSLVPALSDLQIHPPPFCHVALKDPARYIRLLKVASGPEGELLSFSLSTWSIDEAPAYNAISYTWGDLDTTMILINGHPLKVRQNCYGALVQVRQFDSTIFLWVDAICISQGDVEEKNHQVRRMYDVYRNANRVLACIGKH